MSKTYIVNFEIKRSIFGRTFVVKGKPVEVVAETFKDARDKFKDSHSGKPRNIRVTEKKYLEEVPADSLSEVVSE